MRNNCIIILIFLLVCTGCQKTPEEPIVVGKDQQQMIEKAQGETVYTTDAPAGVDWAARLGAPKKYEAMLTSAGGKQNNSLLFPLRIQNPSRLILCERGRKKKKGGQSLGFLLYSMLSNSKSIWLVTSPRIEIVILPVSNNSNSQ